MDPRAHITTSLPFEVAAAHASPNTPIAEPGTTAAALRRAIVGRRYDYASHVAVCEGGRFMGLVRIEELLAAPDSCPIESIMDREPPIAMPGLDQEVAAWRAVRRGESALAVVDEAGRFVGVVPPDRLLGVLLQEHDEDMGRLGGFLKDATAARLASEEPVRRRFWHRLPWLLLGLVGALAAADLVGGFEARLEEKLLLAFFIPGIVYLADAVGTQTETVLVRGLSVGVAVGRVAALELIAGIGIGLALSAVATPIVWWRWGDAEVAVIVGLAILAACSTATLVAMALPWMFDRLGLDPAFGSGPLATVVQDLLSLLLYFGIAVAFAG